MIGRLLCNQALERTTSSYLLKGAILCDQCGENLSSAQTRKVEDCAYPCEGQYLDGLLFGALNFLLTSNFTTSE